MSASFYDWIQLKFYLLPKLVLTILINCLGESYLPIFLVEKFNTIKIYSLTIRGFYFLKMER